MSHYAKILADSVSPEGHRLTTLECRYPRIIHAEVMTHRVFSRNAASSRAIPVKRMIEMVREHPYIPGEWGSNQRGMQAGDALSPLDAGFAALEWTEALSAALEYAGRLASLGVHKQLANRLLEPFSWITVVISATEWDNFLHQREHPDAHPEIQTLAWNIRSAMEASEPEALDWGEWHLPYNEDGADDTLVSVGRCARVSYLGHDGTKSHEADVALAKRLEASGHLSPFEHIATPCKGRWGNFLGWCQSRKRIPGESDFLAPF